MHLISIEEAEPGMVLGQSLYNDRQDLMLAAGYQIKGDVIEMLRARGFEYVYVMDQVADDITPEKVIEDTLRMAAAKTLREAIDSIREHPSLRALKPGTVHEKLEKDPKLRNLLNMGSFRQMASHLLDDIISNNVRLFSSLPIRSADSREMEHALDVALLSILVGQHMGMLAPDLRSLASAALLHDVGKAAIEPFIESLPDPVEERRQDPLWREHPTYSMLIVKGSDPNSFKVQASVHQHHEALDGTGYPAGLKAEDISPLKRPLDESNQIFRFAQVLAVTNLYDNLVSGKFDGNRHTPQQALEVLIEQAGFKLNSYVVRALVQVVQLFPIGTRVRVIQSDSVEHAGYFGVVIENHEGHPAKPTVILTHNSLRRQVQPRKVDFRKDRRVRLELVL